MANDTGNHVSEGKLAYDQRQGKRKSPFESSTPVIVVQIPAQTQTVYAPDFDQDCAPQPYGNYNTLAGHSTQLDDLEVQLD